MTDTPQMPPSYYRWNFFAYLAEITSFRVAMAFISLSSVMPSFLRQLTDSAPLIGLGSTVFSGGLLLPQLAVGRLVSNKLRRKPYMVIPAVLGRVVFSLIPLALFMGLSRYPVAMLGLFFTCFAVFALSEGAGVVVWSDIMARTMSTRQRGRFLGISEIVGGLVGIGAGIFVGKVLGSPNYPFPSEYALLFTLATVGFAASAIALGLIREPSLEQVDELCVSNTDRGDQTGSTDVQAQGGWLRVLWADHAFRHLLVCWVLVSMIRLATPFYAVHAADVLNLPESIVGTFVIAQALAMVIASLGLGLLSERHGPLPVIRVGSAIGVLGPLLALILHLAGRGKWMTWAYPLVFVALGATGSSRMMGFMNYMLEISPEAIRPMYIGTGNTVRGLLMVVPVLGGWLLETTSYAVLFGAAVVVGVIGFVVSLRLGASSADD